MLAILFFPAVPPPLDRSAAVASDLVTAPSANRHCKMADLSPTSQQAEASVAKKASGKSHTGGKGKQSSKAKDKSSRREALGE